jgi:hypothetical protein
MDTQYLLDAFELESRLLDATLRQHPRLRPLFLAPTLAADPGELRTAYLQLLKVSADYVQYTVPALRAAGEALRTGDDEDCQWSALLLGYATGETDEDEGYGHHIWARNDMEALGASADLLDAPPHPAAVVYGNYFVDDVARHPYAILGAKGVLEHLSIRSATDLARGVIDSGIPNASNAISFIHHHGAIDIDHVRDGDRNLRQLGPGPQHKLRQVLEGAYFTSGAYRAMVHHALAAGPR